jgi:hypothetical protein
MKPITAANERRRRIYNSKTQHWVVGRKIVWHTRGGLAITHPRADRLSVHRLPGGAGTNRYRPATRAGCIQRVVCPAINPLEVCLLDPTATCGRELTHVTEICAEC